MNFEYKEVDVQDELDMQYVDALNCFGWEIDEMRTKNEQHIILKRARIIVNKMELIRMERNLLSCFNEIRNLHTSSHLYATLISITLGIFGLLFCILGYLMYRMTKIFFLIIFGIVGLSFISSAYFAYEKVRQNKEKKNNHFIDRKYEEIETLCKKASTFFE